MAELTCFQVTQETSMHLLQMLGTHYSPNLYWNRLAIWSELYPVQAQSCCCATVWQGERFPLPWVRWQQSRCVCFDLYHILSYPVNGAWICHNSWVSAPPCILPLLWNASPCLLPLPPYIDWGRPTQLNCGTRPRAAQHSVPAYPPHLLWFVTPCVSSRDLCWP